MIMRIMLRFLAMAVVGVLVLGLAAPATSQPLMKVEVDCKYGGEIKSIEAVDKLTVKFTFCQADPAFPAKAAFSAFAIHSSDQLNKTGGGGNDLLNNPIGTGPYKLAKWDHGNEIDLVVNENYRGPKPKIKTAIIKWNSEA